MKLMIVDDNLQIREGIALGIEWEKYGIQETIMCSDGLEAYQHLQTFKPDIIIADICMPNMDGLELLSKVHELNHPCRYILLSAYSDFKYAQKAIQLGADDYILKPVNPHKLVDLVVKNIHALRTARQKIYDYCSIYEKIFLNTLFAGNPIESTTQLRNYLKNKYGFEPENNLIFTAILKVSSKTPSHSKFSVSDIASLITPLSNHSRCIISIPSDANSFLLIGKGSHSRMESHILITDFRNCLSKMNRNQEDKKLTITAGISGIFNLPEIHTAYNQANIALDLAYYKDPGALLLYEDHPVSALAAFPEAQQKKYINQITTAVQSTNADLLYNTFSILYKNIHESYYRPADVKDFILRLYSHLIHHTNLEKSVEFEHDVQNTHFNTIFSYLRDMILSSIKQSSSLSTGNYSGLIQNICIYLNEHFREPITVESVAEKFDRTPNYISAKFKKEVGKTFTDYLIELRIQKATAMLTYTNQPISEIAHDVGFNSYAYFSKTFRKYTGKNAGSFRNI